MYEITAATLPGTRIFHNRYYGVAKVEIDGLGMRTVQTPRTENILEMAGHVKYVRRVGRRPALEILQDISEVSCLPWFFDQLAELPRAKAIPEPEERFCPGCNRYCDVTPFNAVCGCSFCISCSQKVRWKIIEEKLPEEYCPVCSGEMY